MAETIKDDAQVSEPESGKADATGAAAGDRRGEDRRGDNRRGHVRVQPNEHNKLAATLASGSDIRLIDLSKGGAQFECDRRFLPNATVSLRLVTRDGQVLVTGRVVRSRIVRLVSGGLGYLVAVAFASPLATELAPDAPAASAVAPPAPTPVRSVSPPPVAGPPPAPEAPTPAASDELVAESDAVVLESQTADPADQLPPIQADITAEEALAFEAATKDAPAMLTVTASVDTTSEQLHDMFDGNDW